MGLQTCMAKDHTPCCGVVRGPRRQQTASDTPYSVNYCVLFIVCTLIQLGGLHAASRQRVGNTWCKQRKMGTFVSWKWCW